MGGPGPFPPPDAAAPSPSGRPFIAHAVSAQAGPLASPPGPTGARPASSAAAPLRAEPAAATSVPPLPGAVEGPRAGPAPVPAPAGQSVATTGSTPSAPPPPSSSFISPASRAALLAGGAAPTIRDALLERGVTLKAYTPGEHRMVCPRCGGGSNRELCFALRIEPDAQGAMWTCHRGTCGWKGGIRLNDFAVRHKAGGGVDKAPVKGGWLEERGERGRGMAGRAERWQASRPRRAGCQPPTLPLSPTPFFPLLPGAAPIAPKKVTAPTKPKPNFEPLTPDVLAWFASRGIGEATLARNGVALETVWSPAHKEKRLSIAFPYTRNGEIVNVKYRTQDKHFTQVKGAEKSLYGLDDVAGRTDIIFVEGEMDKLSLEEAGE